jgi:hypothetical protein
VRPVTALATEVFLGDPAQFADSKARVNIQVEGDSGSVD